MSCMIYRKYGTSYFIISPWGISTDVEPCGVLPIISFISSIFQPTFVLIHLKWSWSRIKFWQKESKRMSWHHTSHKLHLKLIITIAANDSVDYCNQLANHRRRPSIILIIVIMTRYNSLTLSLSTSVLNQIIHIILRMHGNIGKMDGSIVPHQLGVDSITWLGRIYDTILKINNMCVIIVLTHHGCWYYEEETTTATNQ